MGRRELVWDGASGTNGVNERVSRPDWEIDTGYVTGKWAFDAWEYYYCTASAEWNGVTNYGVASRATKVSPGKDYLCKLAYSTIAAWDDETDYVAAAGGDDVRRTLNWSSAADYVIGNIRNHNRARYICIADQLATKSTEGQPGVGVDWTIYWAVTANGNAFNCIADQSDANSTIGEPGVGTSWQTYWVAVNYDEPDVGSAWATYWDVIPSADLQPSVAPQGDWDEDTNYVIGDVVFQAHETKDTKYRCLCIADQSSTISDTAQPIYGTGNPSTWGNYWRNITKWEKRRGGIAHDQTQMWHGCQTWRGKVPVDSSPAAKSRAIYDDITDVQVNLLPAADDELRRLPDPEQLGLTVLVRNSRDYRVEVQCQSAIDAAGNTSILFDAAEQCVLLEAVDGGDGLPYLSFDLRWNVIKNDGATIPWAPAPV